jgi:hypothetical protein
VKRRWPSLIESVPCFPRSSPLGTKLEMIVAGLRRSESFGLARPHARVWPISHLACPHADCSTPPTPCSRSYGVRLQTRLLCSGPLLYHWVCHSAVSSCDMPRASRAATWKTVTEPRYGLFQGRCAILEPRRGCSLSTRLSAALQQFVHDRPRASQGPVCSGAIGEPCGRKR